MSQVTDYEYNTTYDGVDAHGHSVYKIHSASQATVSVVGESLSAGDEFVVNGQVFRYIGGADTTYGHSPVGFFAEGPNSAVHFFATSPISGNLTLVLDTSQAYSTCFMAGTRIATPNGWVAVETLNIGDLVTTTDGSAAAVKWLGRQTVATRFADPARVLPIRIKAGALDDNLPTRDLLVSPCHALLIDGVLIHAGALVNGNSIVREAGVPATFVYYHVETEDHSLILAEGVAAETFIDNVDRMAFDNWEEHLSLYPNPASVQELSYPRAASARQVPAAITRRLAARAQAALEPALDAA